MNGEVLRLEGVTASYEDTDWHMRPVSLAIGTGEMTAVIGPNGSGKSTLLKVASGIISPEGGRALLLGRDMAGYERKEVARILGYLPQQILPTFDYTVEEVVAMGRFPHLAGMGFLSPGDIRIIERCMDQTETRPYRGRSPSRLSGGERQRVYLASILAQEPRLLLLDEPTAALDIHHEAGFFRLLRRLVAGGMAVCVVTHNLNAASLYCDRLLLMSRGGRVSEGAAEEVIRPDVLSEVYGESVVVQKDPRSGRPIVLPVVEEGGAG